MVQQLYSLFIHVYIIITILRNVVQTFFIIQTILHNLNLILHNSNIIFHTYFNFTYTLLNKWCYSYFLLIGRSMYLINPVLNNDNWFKLDLKSSSVSAFCYLVGYHLHSVSLSNRFPIERKGVGFYLPIVVSDIFPSLR